MDLHQFNQKPLEQRAGILTRQGTFLAVRHRSQYVICLYHMNQFFAELWYEPRRHEFVLARGHPRWRVYDGEPGRREGKRN